MMGKVPMLVNKNWHLARLSFGTVEFYRIGQNRYWYKPKPQQDKQGYEPKPSLLAVSQPQ